MQNAPPAPSTKLTTKFPTKWEQSVGRRLGAEAIFEGRLAVGLVEEFDDGGDMPFGGWCRSHVDNGFDGLSAKRLAGHP